MTDRFDTGSPTTAAEILRELRRVHAESEAWLRAMPAAEFIKAQGEKWSPADHARHLTKSVRPLGMALALPRFILWLRFGRTSHGSRSFLAMRETYRARLAAGATAGRFTPSAQPLPRDADAEAYRADVLAAWNAANEQMQSRIGAWDEIALDRYRLPHPVLGTLTVREMLFFTLYHNAHHLNLIASRKG